MAAAESGPPRGPSQVSLSMTRIHPDITRTSWVWRATSCARPGRTSAVTELERARTTWSSAIEDAPDGRSRSTEGGRAVHPGYVDREIMTGFGTVETAIDAMKRGAYDTSANLSRSKRSCISCSAAWKAPSWRRNHPTARALSAVQSERGHRGQSFARRSGVDAFG